jgi:hypothetical protein
MGINRQPSAPTAAAGTPGSTGSADWGAYVMANPDLMADWRKVAQKGRFGSMADYGEYHYGTYGRAEGRELPQTPGTPGTPGAPGTTQEINTGVSPGDFGSLDRSFTLADFHKDPGYQFRVDEGARALDASASARGGVLSGGAAKAMARYGQDMGSQEYGAAYNRYNNDMTTRFNRLSALAGTGQTATNTGIASGANLTGQLQQGVNNITNSNNSAGNARASQYAGTANAIGGAANQVGQYFALKDMYRTPNLAGSAANTIASNPGIF